MGELTSQQLASLVEFGEARAWVNYYDCAPPGFAARYGLAVKMVGSACITMIPQLDRKFFSRINALGVHEAATEPMLDEAIGILESAGCTDYMVQLSPAARPPELMDWLIVRGFIKRNSWAKMYRGTEPAAAAATDLRIERVGREYADVSAEIMLTAFEMPLELRPLICSSIGRSGWAHFLAFDGRHPVAAAAMYILDDVAWLGFGCTLESHRGRGAQSGLFACRIEEGIRRGVNWFVTETWEDTPDDPNPSYRNMLRAGFRLAYMRPNYVHARH